MAFIKEKLTDSYWENIDFKSFTPSQPRKPLYLLSDTNKEAILLPATDSYIARDGLEGFLLIFANRKIFITVSRCPCCAVKWTLWEGATETEINNVNGMLRNALSVYFEENSFELSSNIEFKIHDPYKKETIDELIRRLNLVVQLTIASEKLKSSTTSIQDFETMSIVIDKVSRFFSDSQRNLLIGRLRNNNGIGLSPEATCALQHFIDN